MGHYASTRHVRHSAHNPEAAHSAGRPHRRAAPTEVRSPPNGQSARLHTGVSIGSWKRIIGDLSLKDIRDGAAALTLRDVRDGRYSRLRSSLSQRPTRNDSGCFGPSLSAAVCEAIGSPAGSRPLNTAAKGASLAAPRAGFEPAAYCLGGTSRTSPDVAGWRVMRR